MTRIVKKLTMRLALMFMGAGLATAGAVLLLRAGWIAMAAPLGPIWASVIMGAALVLIGAIVLALSMRERHRPMHSDPELIMAITNAFLQGLAAGRAAGQNAHPARE